MTGLSLRLRIFLFFGLMAGGAVLLAAGALTLGWSRGEAPATPFVTAFVVFALLNTGLLLGVWLLFDENVAKPITRLSADLRMRVHSGVRDALDTGAARYLGDLAPAAAALTQKAEATLEDTAASIARETERLGTEAARLTALLTESPIATILVNPAGDIVLYDAQAAALLAHIATPRLRAPLSDYFEASDLQAVLSTPDATGGALRPVGASTPVHARVKALGVDGHMLFFDPPEVDLGAVAQRPLVFDFDLICETQARAVKDQALDALCFVVLDLETTGLSVDHDAIVQIGAVRVLNGAIVPGEVLSTYVNPERPIPSAASRIHHVRDADVREAPKIDAAGRMLHHFARDAVLVAHNAPFDIGLLRRHEGRGSMVWDHPVLDTVLLSAVVFGATEDHSLDALCERLGIEIAAEDRHTALGDARATAEALVRLLKMVTARGYATFGALQPELDRQARRLYSSR